jgi:hypothetical protein
METGFRFPLRDGILSGLYLNPERFPLQFAAMTKKFAVLVLFFALFAVVPASHADQIVIGQANLIYCGTCSGFVGGFSNRVYVTNFTDTTLTIHGFWVNGGPPGGGFPTVGPNQSMVAYGEFAPSAFSPGGFGLAGTLAATVVTINGIEYHLSTNQWSVVLWDGSSIYDRNLDIVVEGNPTVPEPTSIILLGSGMLAGISGFHRKLRRHQATSKSTL